MARNPEKNLAGLNRLVLQEQRAKNKKAKRPPLNSLNSAVEIRRWIPSIKAEIEHCLRHLSGVRNYPDSKIREFQERLKLLETEHQQFLAKLKQLDPIMSSVIPPGQPHAYISKRKLAQLEAEEKVITATRPTEFPIYGEIPHGLPPSTRGTISVGDANVEYESEDVNLKEDVKVQSYNNGQLEPPWKRLKVEANKEADQNTNSSGPHFNI